MHYYPNKFVQCIDQNFRVPALTGEIKAFHSDSLARYIGRVRSEAFEGSYSSNKYKTEDDKRKSCYDYLFP